MQSFLGLFWPDHFGPVQRRRERLCTGNRERRTVTTEKGDQSLKRHAPDRDVRGEGKGFKRSQRTKRETK